MLKFLREYVEKIIPIAICGLVLICIGIYSGTVIKEKAADGEIAAVLSENDKKDTISVYVGGEVVNAGEYSLKEGSRVGDAIEAAGGFKESANKKINVAVLLKDGDSVIVANEDEPANSGIDYKVNINTASTKELVALEGIGEKTAEKIIDYREKNGGFSSPEGIMNVSGIGEGTYEKIKDIIVAE